MKNEKEEIDKLYDKHIDNNFLEIKTKELKEKINNLDDKQSIYKIIDLQREFECREKYIKNNKDNFSFSLQNSLKSKISSRHKKVSETMSLLINKINSHNYANLEEKTKLENSYLYLQKESNAINKVDKSLQWKVKVKTEKDNGIER